MSAEELLLNSVIDNLDVVVQLRSENHKLKRKNKKLKSKNKALKKFIYNYKFKDVVVKREYPPDVIDLTNDVENYSIYSNETSTQDAIQMVNSDDEIE